jgi:hypothetical protein
LREKIFTNAAGWVTLARFQGGNRCRAAYLLPLQGPSEPI